MTDPTMKAAFHEQFGGSPKHDAVDERFAAGWTAAIAEIEFAKHDAFNEGVSETEDWFYHQRAIEANPYPRRAAVLPAPLDTFTITRGELDDLLALTDHSDRAWLVAKILSR